MNIDFSHQPLFSWYVVLLMFSGVVSLALSSPAFGRASVGLRLLNCVVGLAMFGYGFYLAFIFTGGTYLIFFKAFIVPAVLIVRTAMSIVGRNRRSGAPQAAYPAAGVAAFHHPVADAGWPQPAPPYSAASAIEASGTSDEIRPPAYVPFSYIDPDAQRPEPSQ